MHCYYEIIVLLGILCQITRHFICVSVAPSVEISPTTAIVIEGNGLVLTCNASGKPEPSITWTKVGSSHQVLSYTSSLTIANARRPGNPDNMIQYQCTASDGVKSPASATAAINVHCRYSKLNLLLWQRRFVNFKSCMNL